MFIKWQIRPKEALFSYFVCMMQQNVTSSLMPSLAIAPFLGIISPALSVLPWHFMRTSTKVLNHILYTQSFMTMTFLRAEPCPSHFCRCHTWMNGWINEWMNKWSQVSSLLSTSFLCWKTYIFILNMCSEIWQPWTWTQDQLITSHVTWANFLTAPYFYFFVCNVRVINT